MRKINLSGPEGNAFYLLALMQETLPKVGHSKEEIESIMTDMQSGGYSHLIAVFQHHLGDVYELVDQ